MNENQDNLLNIIGILYRWRKPIIFTCSLVALGSIIISLLLPTYYRATTIFYPSNPALNSPSVIFGTSQKDLDFYGDADDIDRLISIASSGELIDFMIDNFNLYKHYKIDTFQDKAAYKVRIKFLKFYEVIKNARNGIELTIEDKDPLLAAKMANAARDKIDELALRLNYHSQQKLLSTFETSIKNKQNDIFVLNDSLKQLRYKYGVYLDFKKENNAGNLLNIRPRDNNIEQFNEGLSYVQVLTQLLESKSKELAEEIEHHDKLKAAFNSGISALHIQDKANIPLVKSRPARTLIVLSSIILAFIFSVLAVLLLDRYKHTNWDSVMNNS